MKRGGSLSILVRTISNVLVMEIGWTDVGSGGYILVSCAHSNTSCKMPPPPPPNKKKPAPRCLLLALIFLLLNDPRRRGIWIFSSSQMGCVHDYLLCTFILGQKKYMCV